MTSHATLIQVLSAERLKLKRTIALKMVVVAPVSVVLLTLFMASQAPFSTLHQATTMDLWRALSRVNLQFWAILMLPMYVTLQTALVAGLDHTDNQWKALFARPVPRWTVYVAKLAVVGAMVLASVAILLVGILAEGKILHWYAAELRFGAIPYALLIREIAEMTGLAFLFLTIQLWVSLRWRSFSVAIGFGIIALVTSFAMALAAGQYGAWPQYFPWCLPMLVIARQPQQNISTVLWISILVGIAVSAAGCIDFCRRDIC